jgi:prepilin-type N-terminal cleavage/methylation domain-containing protein
MRRGFTLVELVVVILILGILAGVAAPKFFDASDKASENGAKQSLQVIREAIEVFQAANGGRLPGANGDEATFKAELAPHLRKFPVLPVGPTPAHNNTVLMSGDAGPPSGSASPSEGWKYYYNSGDFIINLHKKLKSDNSVYYDQL